MSRRSILILLLSLTLPAQSFFDQAAQVLVRFTGVVRNADKKKLELEIDGEQSLTFYVNRKTVYREGKKTVKSAESMVGRAVTIEARQEFQKDLVAVIVMAGEAAADEQGLKRR